MTTLSERINAALEYRKMSQSELARRLGVTRQAVSLWCAAGTKDISATNAMLIAKELEVDPYWLVLGKGEMKPPKRLEEHEIKMVLRPLSRRAFWPTRTRPPEDATPRTVRSTASTLR